MLGRGCGAALRGSKMGLLRRRRRQLIGHELGDRGQVHKSLSQRVGRIPLAGREAP